MKIQKNTLTVIGSLLLSVLMATCRQDDEVVMPTIHETGMLLETDYAGLYVLCEGNMGSNKATLDYLDFATGQYHKNIFPSRNPQQVMELGDVGNDVQIYGQQLWLVINCSNKVEVCDARTTRSRGHVSIPNCRFVAFHEGYAYVSSYVGGSMQEWDVRGSVYQVDTATLQITARVEVGYQPDELCVVGNYLYVANSGGYKGGLGRGYDHTVSVIDLASMSVVHTIDVAPNLFRLRADHYGQLWVTSRGIEGDSSHPSRLYVIEGIQVTDSIDTPVSDMALLGDSLCYMGTEGRQQHYGLIDVRTHRIVNTHLLQAGDYSIETPYGLLIHPLTGHLYVMDATNYVSSGWLLCFDRNGRFLWRTSTGDIPGHGVFVRRDIGGTDNSDTPHPTQGYSRYLQAVDEYVPAPGQFVNTMPPCDAHDTPQSVAAKCSQLLADGRGSLVSLGGFGGYITFHFDHPVANIAGQRDLAIWGNAIMGNSEPGIVMVAQDANHNGQPDDEWFELRGSADEDSAGLVVYDYEMTYRQAPLEPIPWTDNRGHSGHIWRNDYHLQEYYPLWLPDGLTLRGTLLPPNGSNQATGGAEYWVLSALRYGYVDNQPNTQREANSFDLAWAVDRERRPVSLSHADFVRVYCAQNQQCGWIGETSTEVSGAEDLHLDESISFYQSILPNN